MEPTAWIEAFGVAAAGAAAVYAAVRGVQEYRDSMRFRKATMLSEIETEFRKVLPTLARIEDDGSFQAFGETLAKEAAREDLSEGDIRRMNRLDLVFRFFFVLRVKQRWIRELEEMNPVYQYYRGVLRKRDIVRSYATRYYPGLLD